VALTINKENKIMVKMLSRLFLAIIFIFSGAIYCNAQTVKKTVKVAYLPITHALPLYVEHAASDNLKSAKIELVRFGSWPELMDALNTGKVDGASVLVELAIKTKENGIDLKAVALGHRDGNVVVTSLKINTLADIKGKTFAIPHRLSSHNILLHLLLRKAGITQSDIKVVELPPPEMPVALAEGRIDGYIVAEPFGAKSVVNGRGKLLYRSENLWQDSVCCVFVLRNDFIKKYTTEAKELVAQYIKAGSFITSNPLKTKEIAKQYIKVEPAVLDLSLQWIEYNDLRFKEKDYNELIKYMVELNLLKSPPQYSDFVDNSLFGGK